MSAARRLRAARPGNEACDLDALARSLAPVVARQVLELLARALAATEAPYSTRRGFAPPEFTGRPRAWRATARSIPGAVRIGRWVSVPRAAYAAWLASQGGPGVATATAPANDSSTAWSPVAALAAAGLRATR